MNQEQLESLVFRDIRPEDYGEVAEMILSLYAEDPCGEPMTREKIEKTFAHLAGHPDNGRVIVLSVDEAIAGYAIVVSYWSNEYGGYVQIVDELYVKESYRKRGIATRLFAELERGKEAGVQGLRLEVTPTNEQADQLYQRLGFRREKRNFMVKKL